MAQEATVQVEAARIPDRDRLLRMLADDGVSARPVNEIGIEVPCGDDADGTCNELLATVEAAIMDIGAPFVPVKHEGVIYVRPPVG